MKSGPLPRFAIATSECASVHATMLLADLGATVIKVEGPYGDDIRTWMPPTRGEISTYDALPLLDLEIGKWCGREDACVVERVVESAEGCHGVLDGTTHRATPTRNIVPVEARLAHYRERPLAGARPA
ncbi:CoA transferase [Calidifontibacter indicus]|uniref:CoA transferase n=1 Tax=Calidifontibacter indicus TaxID=419650 RepID=UPI003D72E0DF